MNELPGAYLVSSLKIVRVGLGPTLGIQSITVVLARNGSAQELVGSAEGSAESLC